VEGAKGEQSDRRVLDERRRITSGEVDGGGEDQRERIGRDYLTLLYIISYRHPSTPKVRGQLHYCPYLIQITLSYLS